MRGYLLRNGITYTPSFLHFSYRPNNIWLGTFAHVHEAIGKPFRTCESEPYASGRPAHQPFDRGEWA